MSVYVVDAGGRLTGKAGHIIIVDIASARVQQVEDLKLRRPVLAELVADVAIKKGGCLRLDGAILGKWTGPKIAQPETCRPSFDRVIETMNCDAAVEGCNQRLRHEGACGLIAGEAGMRPGIVG